MVIHHPNFRFNDYHLSLNDEKINPHKFEHVEVVYPLKDKIPRL